MDRSPDSSTANILDVTSHRPWPLPTRPWIMYQRWHDLLFAHWPLPVDSIRPHVPPQLDLDTFDCKVWVGVIPFWMSRVHFRGVPALPTASTFPELNVRTYVRAPQDPHKPGVYFFSLDAASLLAVLGARAGVGLPYFWAEMRAQVAAGEVQYRSQRRQKPRPAELVGRYRPTGPVSLKKTDLERFVTERYCLYVVRRGRIHRVQIHHLPWPLQPAEAEFDINTMAQASGIELSSDKPALQFSRLLEVFIFPPEEIG